MIRGMQNVSSIFLNDLAATIGKLEKRNKAAQFILETAAILHDIGRKDDKPSKDHAIAGAKL